MGSQAVYGLKVLNKTIFFIHGTENVEAIRKYKTSITTPGVQTFCLTRVFAMCRKAVKMYSLDDSGILQKPHPQSAVASQNRIDYLTHAGFHKLMSGEGLSNLYKRWSTNFEAHLKAMKIGDDWTTHYDILDFWLLPLTASLNEAIAGPILEIVNPDFTRDFLEFVPWTHALMKGLPNWCIPRAVSLRSKLVRDVKQWHAIARAISEVSNTGEIGDNDPLWGSDFIRDRQQTLSKVDNWDYDSIASSDFGLLWG